MWDSREMAAMAGDSGVIFSARDGSDDRHGHVGAFRGSGSSATSGESTSWAELAARGSLSKVGILIRESIRSATKLDPRLFRLSTRTPNRSIQLFQTAPPSLKIFELVDAIEVLKLARAARMKMSFLR